MVNHTSVASPGTSVSQFCPSIHKSLKLLNDGSQMAFSGGIFLILIGSMYLRYLNLKKDMLVIEQLAEDD